MSHPAPPVLTVRHDGSEGTFAAGHDVVIGRDLRADMRITHPLVSRAHLLLRFEQGRWLGDRQRLAERHLRQRPAGAGRRHPRRPEHQPRQSGRAAGDLRGRTAPGAGRPAAADRSIQLPPPGIAPPGPRRRQPGPAAPARPPHYAAATRPGAPYPAAAGPPGGSRHTRPRRTAAAAAPRPSTPPPRPATRRAARRGRSPPRQPPPGWRRRPPSRRRSATSPPG